MRPCQVRRHVLVDGPHGIAVSERAQLHCRHLPGSSNGDTHGRRVIRFLQPEWLWLLALLPVVMMLRGRRGPVATIEFSDVGLAREVARRSRARIGGWVWLLPLLAAALMIVGLARPQRGHSRTEVTANGIDIVLGLDVSGSMQALDFEVDNQRVN